jgi:hypothetical protein
VPTIEIETDDPIQRHLAALRIMSYMVFPDDPELRKASETTFRTRIADWYSQVFATREKKAQIQFVKGCPPKSSNELQRALADPATFSVQPGYRRSQPPARPKPDPFLARRTCRTAMAACCRPIRRRAAKPSVKGTTSASTCSASDHY